MIIFLLTVCLHLECLHDNTTKIRNVRAYLLTSIFNAPSTINHYYQAEVNHDLYG